MLIREINEQRVLQCGIYQLSKHMPQQIRYYDQLLMFYKSCLMGMHLETVVERYKLEYGRGRRDLC